MPSSSTAIQARTVFRQDTEPGDTGALWLDTATTPPTLKQYNSSTSAWEPVSSSVVSRQNTAPTGPKEGDLWQDTSVSPPVLKSYSNGKWSAAGTVVSRITPPKELGSLWIRPTPVSINQYVADYGGFAPVAVSGEPAHEIPVSEASGPPSNPYHTTDATLNGNVSQVSGEYIGGYALDSPGNSGDYVDLGTLGSFGSELETGFAVGFTIETTDQFFVMGAVDGDQEFTIATDAQGFGTDGHINFQLDGNSGSNTDGIETNNRYDDGNRYRVVCQASDGKNGSTYEIWVNGSQTSTTTTATQGPGRFADFSNSVRLFSRTDRSECLDGIVDDVFIYYRTLTSTEIQTDYNKQPWV